MHQGQCIGAAVSDEEVTGGWIPAGAPHAPELYSIGAVNTMQFRRPVDSETLLNVFQTAGKSVMVAEPAQINVGAGQFRNIEMPHYARYIKRISVKGGKQFHVIEESKEGIEVFALYKVMQCTAVIAGDNGYGTGAIEAVCFNIKKGRPCSVARKKPPVINRPECIDKEPDVIIFQGFPALFNGSLELQPTPGTDSQAACSGRKQVVPCGYALFLQAGQPFGADTGQMLQCLADQC